MYTDVFISYARSSSLEHARKLRDVLAGDGVEVFLDERDVPFGNPFPRDIAEHLLASRVFVVFADETYFQRPWCVYEFQVVTAPYRAAADAAAEQLQHVVVTLPESAELGAVTAHLPPPLAASSWPLAGSTTDIASTVRTRLTSIESNIAGRLSGVNDAAVQRLQAAGDIPLPWAERVPPGPTEPDSRPPARPRRIGPALESRAEEFIGRGAELWQVFHDLVTCRTFRPHPSCVIQGVGGSGKSQLAAEFLARYADRFFPGGVVWINAEGDDETLAAQFSNVLNELAPSTPDPSANEPDPARRRALLGWALQAHLSSAAPAGERLWIVDGIPEPSGPPRKIAHWCPALEHVSVLATSRRTGIEGVDAHVDLGSLTLLSAVELLTRPEVDRRWLAEDEWKDLGEWAGRLPLAISILHASLADGFTTAEALKQARRKEPSTLLDREMEALREEVADERLRGITDAFAFSYRMLESKTPLRNAAHLIGWLAPYPLSEKLMAELVPAPLLGRLAKRSWIQPVTHSEGQQASRHWMMHRIPASFLRTHTSTAESEFASLFEWLGHLVQTSLESGELHALAHHLMVIQRRFQTELPAFDARTSAAVRAAGEFAVATVEQCFLDSAPSRESAGLRYIAADLANQLNAGEAVATCLEQAYGNGTAETAAAIPHTLGALVGQERAVALMSRMLHDADDQIRNQAIVHAPGLRALELAIPLLDALLHQTSTDLAASYDAYLNNQCPALAEILTRLLKTLQSGTPGEQVQAAELLGRVLIVNRDELAADGYTSQGLITALLQRAMTSDSEFVRSTAVSSAAHYFQAEAYGLLVDAQNKAADTRERAWALSLLGQYLSETRRPPSPSDMQVEWLDSGGIRISGHLGKVEPLPDGVYAPLLEAVADQDPECAGVAARAILDTDEGKMAAGEVAHQWLDAQEFGRVLAMSTALAREGPDFTNAWWWRGQANEEMGNTASALEDYSTVIEQTPGFADAYLNRGRLLAIDKRFTEAAPDLLRAGEFDPELFIAHHLASLALYNLERYEEAEVAATRAIDLAPDVHEAHFFRSIARYAAGDAEGALEDVERAAALEPSDERVTDFRSQLRSYLGQAP